MATNGRSFPAQRQETQPGKQHVMDPTPKPGHSEYMPANKLQVRIYDILCSSYPFTVAFYLLQIL